MDKVRMRILIDGIENGLSNRELVMLSKYTSSYIRKVERNLEKYKSLIIENPPKKKREKKENTDKENIIPVWQRRFSKEWKETINNIVPYLDHDIKLVAKI